LIDIDADEFCRHPLI